MIVAICIKVAFILCGILAALLSVSTLVKRSTTPIFTVIWIIFGVLLIITGIFIEPYNWAQFIGIPTIALIGILCLAAILFLWYLTKKIDELQLKMQETAIQLTILNDENAQIRQTFDNKKEKVLQKKNPSFSETYDIHDKKILFVNNTLSTGGAEKVMITMMKKYLEKNNKVYLYVMTGMGELISELPEEVTLLNTNYDEESVLSEEGKKKLTNKVAKAEVKSFTGLRLFGYQTRALANMIRNGKIRAEKLAWRVLAETAPIISDEYDIAIAFTEGASTYYVADRVAANHKIAFVHIPYDHAGYTKQLDKNSYDAFEEIVAVSDSVRASFIEVHPECSSKVHVYENDIDYKLVEQKSKEPTKEQIPWTNDNLKILTVARLVAQKSYNRIIEVAKILKEKGYNFTWIALGEGEDRASIQEQINNNNLQDNFILMGNVSNPYPYMASCDVYVHATSYEGKSVAIREAKALGCPVVVTKVSGSEDVIVDEQTGLFASLDANDIANKVSTLLDNRDYAKQLGQAAKKQETNQE